MTAAAVPKVSSSEREFRAVPALRDERHASLYTCATIREPLAEPQTFSPRTDPAARRRARLARGARCWTLALDWHAVRVRRVAHVTLTYPAGDQAVAQGQAIDFWRRVRQRFPGTRYFCWLELTKRGQVHYHALWLNPPPYWRIDLQRWIKAHHPAGRTRVTFPDKRWDSSSALEYVLDYSKKMGRKAYQQAYENLEVPLRTYMTQRNGWPPAVLGAHLDRWEARYLAPGARGNPTSEGVVQLVAHLNHVPMGDPSSRRRANCAPARYVTRGYDASRRRWRIATGRRTVPGGTPYRGDRRQPLTSASETRQATPPMQVARQIGAPGVLSTCLRASEARLLPEV